MTPEQAALIAKARDRLIAAKSDDNWDVKLVVFRLAAAT